MIDLDTVMPGLVGHDFGDAIRFAANFVEEDCPQADKAGVNIRQNRTNPGKRYQSLYFCDIIGTWINR